jgi:hypothetical protein
MVALLLFWRQGFFGERCRGALFPHLALFRARLSVAASQADAGTFDAAGCPTPGAGTAGACQLWYGQVLMREKAYKQQAEKYFDKYHLLLFLYPTRRNRFLLNVHEKICEPAFFHKGLTRKNGTDNCQL